MKITDKSTLLTEGFQIENAVHGHSFKSDEPIENGGTNVGPNSFQLFTAALGSSLTALAKIEADSQRIILHGFEVEVEVDAEVGGLQNPTITNLVNEVIYTAKIDAELDNAEKERFLKSCLELCSMANSLVATKKLIVK